MEVTGNISPDILDAIEKADRFRDRRRNPEGRQYQIRELRLMHHEILRLALLGLNNTDISTMLNITTVMVSNVLNSEIAKRQLEIMSGNRDADALAVREQIANMAPLALEVLEGIMMDENASDRNKITAAVDILDRGGYAAPKVIQGQFLTAHLTPADIQSIKDRARATNNIAVSVSVGGNGESSSCENGKET